jgi:hypothetical protein
MKQKMQKFKIMWIQNIICQFSGNKVLIPYSIIYMTDLRCMYLALHIFQPIKFPGVLDFKTS